MWVLSLDGTIYIDVSAVRKVWEEPKNRGAVLAHIGYSAPPSVEESGSLGGSGSDCSDTDLMSSTDCLDAPLAESDCEAAQVDVDVGDVTQVDVDVADVDIAVAADTPMATTTVRDLQTTETNRPRRERRPPTRYSP